MIITEERIHFAYTMMDPNKQKVFDVAEYLDTNESISIFLEEAFRSANPQKIAEAIEVVATAKGMTLIAKKSGIPRDVLFKKVINEKHPSMELLLPVLKGLGVKTKAVHAVPAQHIMKPESADEGEHISLLGSKLWMRFFSGLTSTPSNPST